MRVAGVFAGWLLAVVGVPAVAQTLPWQVEAAAGVDHLSNGAPDWRQVDLSLRRQLAPRSVAELNLRSTRRSGLNDEELGAAVGLPLNQRWSLALAATLSPSHRVLARGSARVELTRTLDDGWVAGASFGRRVYDDGGNSQWGLGLERYVAAWRVAAGVGQTRLDGGGAATSLRLQLDRYFADERGRVGVIVASGRELEGLPATPGNSADLIDQRVRLLAVTGAWPVATAWALTAEASHVRYDDVRRRSGAFASVPYQRSGVRLGVRYDF